MSNMKFDTGDTIITKKKHPCSSDSFKVMRVGSDIRIVCNGCSRDMTLPRVTVEKMIKKIIPKTEME